jgi:hypothetical protein
LGKAITAVVITGDIIAYSKLSSLRRKKLQNRLNAFIKKMTAEYPDFKAEQFRGDSLQGIFTKNQAAALRTALSLYCCLVAEDFKIRQSIGIGDISFNGNNIITSDGTAFRISGQNIDELKKRNELIVIAAADKAFTEEWQIHSGVLNFLLERLSSAQAEALYLQLRDTRQEDIAKALHISQPSVHQRLQAAGWAVINPVLQRFETTVPAL